MYQPPETGSPLRGALQVLSRHRGKWILFFCAVLGISVAAALLAPRTYRSQAKLLVRLGRETVTLDPTATLGQGSVVAVPQSRENDINSVVEILRSRSLLDQVVDRVGADAILGKGAPLPAPAKAEPSEEKDDRDPAPRTYPASHELARRKLARQLSVEAVKKTNIIELTCEAPSPETAEAVVSALVSLYLEQHARLHRTPGAHRFLAQQTAQAHTQLVQAEKQLREAQAETGLFAPEGQKQLTLTRIGKLEDDLLQTGASLASAEAELEQLKSKLATLPQSQVISRSTGAANDAVDILRGQLNSLQLKELELLARHPSQHPDVVLVRQQIATARDLLSREERSRELVTSGPSRLYEETRLAVLKQEPAVAALRAKADLVRDQLQKEKQVLKTISDNSLRLADLQRAVEMQTALHRRYSESLAQTQVDRALDAEKISSISIVQPASYDAQAVKPQKSIYLAIGFVFALCGSIGLVWLAEAWQRPEPLPVSLPSAGLPSPPTAPLTGMPTVAVGRN